MQMIDALEAKFRHVVHDLDTVGREEMEAAFAKAKEDGAKIAAASETLEADVTTLLKGQEPAVVEALTSAFAKYRGELGAVLGAQLIRM